LTLSFNVANKRVSYWHAQYICLLAVQGPFTLDTDLKTEDDGLALRVENSGHGLDTSL